jgi:uncharacterized membrane protein
MESKVKVFGHPVHPILISIPLGLLSTSVLFDIVHILWRPVGFARTSFNMIGAGLIGGMLAAVFGLIDWLAIPPNTRAKRIGFWHGLINGVVMMLFGTSWFLRRERPRRPSGLALTLALIGGSLAGISGWLGGELVYRLRVGVDENANLNAPNSLEDGVVDLPEPDEVTNL